MAVCYVDLTGSGSSTSPFDTWATATTVIQTAITTAGTGGQVFVKTNAAATNKDTAAATRTLTFPAGSGKPCAVYGCKSTTTNEPPVDSDLCVRGTDNLPIFEATGAGNDINFGADGAFFGIKFDAPDRLQTVDNEYIKFHDCEFAWTGLFFINSYSALWFYNCDFQLGNTAAKFLPRLSSRAYVYGGIFSGSAPDAIVGSSPTGAGMEFYGTDIGTLSTGNVMNAGGAEDTFVRLVNCEMSSGYTLFGGTIATLDVWVEVISSSNATGISSGSSVRVYEYQDLTGSVSAETTAIRTTGGANDGASGGFSYALTPAVDSTIESVQGVRCPTLSTWVDGDGTSKTATVYIANSGASDYRDDDVIVHVFSPSAAGTTQHDLTRLGDKIAGTTTVITDDTVSSWGTGAANPQKLEISIAPDYSGEVYIIIEFCKTFPSSPETLYVDPLITIA